jgi:hypothetical protein
MVDYSTFGVVPVHNGLWHPLPLMSMGEYVLKTRNTNKELNKEHIQGAYTLGEYTYKT